jgi:hypothetical protein
MEYMNVRAEIWPVAADEVGIWLLSGGDSWETDIIRQDSEPHFEVESVLVSHGIKAPDNDLFRHGVADHNLMLLHSTSWRRERSTIVLTYIAVVATSGLVRSEWPDSLPVAVDMASEVGPAPTHLATSTPQPRYVDVLLHAVRHLRFLLGTDASARDALAEPWPSHLESWTPALAGLYMPAHPQVDPHSEAKQEMDNEPGADVEDESR